MAALHNPSDTLTYAGELLVVKCWCGMRHGIPAELRRHQLRVQDQGGDPVTVYCPLGHAHIPAGESTADRLTRQLREERDRAAYARAAQDQAEASARAYKGVATKARKRAAAATCPCCKRSFVQLRRHLESKHPDYTGAVE